MLPTRYSDIDYLKYLLLHAHTYMKAEEGRNWK